MMLLAMFAFNSFMLLLQLFLGFGHPFGWLGPFLDSWSDVGIIIFGFPIHYFIKGSPSHRMVITRTFYFYKHMREIPNFNF